MFVHKFTSRAEKLVGLEVCCSKSMPAPDNIQSSGFVAMRSDICMPAVDGVSQTMYFVFTEPCINLSVSVDEAVAHPVHAK